jgi:hypothetical protein
MILMVLAGMTAMAQTQIDLRSQARGVDFSGASSTKPMKAGTTLPLNCAPGEMFFKIDAGAGANLYGCTAANTWSVEGGISSQNCWYDSADSTLKCRDAAGNTYAAVKTASSGSPNQWVDYIGPSGIPHTSQPTPAGVGALADPGSNGIPYRSGLGISAPATADQLSGGFYCQDPGTSVNAYACNLSPAIAAYRAGTTYWFKAGTTNTGPASVNFNGLGAKAIKKSSSQDLSAGDIQTGQWVLITYDGGNMQMQSQTANPPGTLVMSVFGRTGAIAAQTGDYTTAKVTESGNLYFTDARAQAAFSYPGAVKLSAGALDCPSCITSSTPADTDLFGSFPHLSVVKLQGRPVAATAPSDQQYLGWNGGAGRWEPKSLPAAPVSSIFGRTGAVSAQSGDYSFAQIAGTLAASQLPGAAMRLDQGNAVTAGTQNFSGADHTLPMKSGPTANLPAGCLAGETYFATDAPLGNNLYGCTPGNHWSVQGAGMSIASDGVTVGSRAAANFLAGPGLMSVLADTGSEIDIQWALDSAVVQTQPGEQSGTALLCAPASGSATDYQCFLNPTASGYTTGMVLHWQPDVGGRGGPTTLNVDGLGAKPIKLSDGVSDPGPADIIVGRMYEIWYDGANFRFITTAANIAGGISDPGANGIVYRSGTGTAAPATADQMSGPFSCQAAGSGGNYTCNLTPPITAYTAGTTYWFRAGTANTGMSTININSLGARTIKKQSGQDLAANDILAGQWVMITYDGTNMQMLSQAATVAAGGGSVGSVFGRTGAVTAAAGDYTTALVPESGSLYFTDARAQAAVTWSTLTGKPPAFVPSAHAGTHQHGGSDELATATPAANAIPKAGAGGKLAAGWLPAPTASTLGGVQASDCSAVGFVQRVNADGSISCGAGGGSGGGSGATVRTWPYFWQGAVQAAATGFAVNLPAAGAPTLTNAGGTRPVPVLEWPVGQSAYYGWWAFVLPAGYAANSGIAYTLETRSADSTNWANVYLGLACSSAALDNPTIVETAPAPITANASSYQTVTTGTLTPNGGGLPPCSAGQRVWINMRVDTNVAGHVMSQPFDLISAMFSVQGSM